MSEFEAVKDKRQKKEKKTKKGVIRIFLRNKSKS